MIVDAHVHLEMPGPKVDPDDLGAMLRRADAAGIDRMLLAGSIGMLLAAPDASSPTGQSIEHIRATNDQTMSAIELQPDRLWGLCYINPLHGDEARDEIFRTVRDGPLCGIKLLIAVRANDPSVNIVAQTAMELDVAILQHAWNRTGGNDSKMSSSADVAELAVRYPDLRIQMAHLGGVGIAGVDHVANCPNVWIDTSGAQPVAGLLEYALKRIGPERIVFGSDYTVREFAVKRAITEAVVTGESARRAVMSGNAEKLWHNGRGGS